MCTIMKLCIFLLAIATRYGLKSFHRASYVRFPILCKMGFFDNIFSKSTPDSNNNPASKSLKDIEKEEQMQAQREILERRRNPKKMLEYEQMKEAERLKYAEERAVYKFQTKSGDETYDPINEWKRLKDEGKIKMSKDLERDSKSSRLGSEGLIEVRVDERMPYIDQGITIIAAQ